MALKHATLWEGLDALAKEHGYTVSGLARAAGLDPSALNPSKRISKEGIPRWPSTESLAKIMEVTGATLTDLARHVDGLQRTLVKPIPFVSLDQINDDMFDPNGIPIPEAKGWGRYQFDLVPDPRTFAVEVAGVDWLHGNSGYFDGDVLVISPSATVKRGIKVILRTKAGETLLGLLGQYVTHYELRRFDSSRQTHTLALDEVLWLSRIVWATQ